MKCKVLCLLLCVLFCFSCFSLSSSAVSPYDTPEYLLQRGWVYDESDGSYYLPFGVVDPYLASFPANMMAPTPYYPNFDYKKIPWQSAPSFIKEILYMPWLSSFDETVKNMPFILIRVSGSTAHVFVGYNLGFGYDETDRYRICTPFFNNGSLNSVGLDSVCYSASFSTVDYSVKSDWTRLSYTNLGNTGNLVYYGSTLAYSSSEYDFYFYGGNRVKSFSAQLAVTYAYEYKNGVDSTGGSRFVYFNCHTSGFASGQFFWYQDYDESLPYGQYFIPPTESEIQYNQQQQIIDGQQEMIEKQEESNETQKGMWDSIKALPTQIASSIKGFFTSLGDRISGFFEKLVEDIKGLFIPAEGFFDTYTEEFQTYFEERLGILYELPEAVVGIFQQFLTFEPATDGYYIPIPEVVLPVKLEDGTYQDFTIFEQQDYEFDFLSEGAIGTLYNFYRAFCWLVCILALIYFAIRKFEKLTGG